ncbi:carbon-nitrogen hydrolase family protein [Nocardia sp. alder85J]|uniref:carbon-nitrogen hydrolase family protein n=1 Tax=Nocardia sp. alder85J TaxID=2862949 RepID=UPI001CD56579|nr:carbon-nitrogen hydrolase family protein [Nocardia sp. alder85J]MCX4095965.1 carbon-nitrogen hydrolase family protein [Nocardia sp. alder85J]
MQHDHATPEPTMVAVTTAPAPVATDPVALATAELEAEIAADPALAPQAPGRTTVAVVQFGPYTDKTANLAALRDHVREAAALGARVVVAPEYSMFAVMRLDDRVLAAAEPLTGEYVTGLRGLAAEFGVYLVAGVVEAPGGQEHERIYNTLVVAGPDAEFVIVYRKVHLYDAFGFRESSVILPGEITAPATFTVDGVVFGLQTCFDLRFPEGCRRVAAAGAQVLLLPAQWIPGPGKVDQWTTLLRARAIENTIYVAAADHAAPRGCGASMIVDPSGTVLAELGEAPGVAAAGIDLALVDQVRATNPSLSLRRFDIVPGAESDS